ncbi:hypothetical protein DSOUD_2269 [Desulfuromonas soudanensis]|uniref:Uncharacterized protein n=1 Tax=Desulfuromonas soudanensis TaxID=1603606 RepID=A0A0M3QG19_9BACT|nr:hypothetical protein DSOUD_2269 [Desulfuromonas soudanensis]
MDVIVHEAEGMNAVAKATGSFLKEKEKSRSVFICREDGLACVAAENHVIHGAGEMYSWFTCHGG